MVELWNEYLWPLIWIVIKILVIVVPVLLSVAYLTYWERKIIGSMQLRRGPNVVGPFGLLSSGKDSSWWVITWSSAILDITPTSIPRGSLASMTLTWS